MRPTFVVWIGTALLAWMIPGAVAAAIDDEPAASATETPESADEPLPLDRMVGQRLSNFTLTDAVSGRPYSLYGFAGKKGAVLIFMGTECPVGNVYAPRLIELNHEYRSKGFVFLGINSNAGDSESEIAEHAKQFELDFPILKDRDNVVADSALADRTPEILVLDGMARIRYRGAIDDQYSYGARRPEPRNHYLRDALDAILEDRKVETPATKVVGCLIERVEPKVVRRSENVRVRPASPEIMAAREEIDPEVGDIGQVTYASDVAAIVQNKCQSCHRPGQVAPFPLTNYDEVRKHSAMIEEVVDNLRMPPWHADPRHGEFSNDRSLTAKERATLLAWIERGMPLGDPKDIPEAPSYPEGWSIGEPDVVFELPKPYTVPAQGVVDYVYVRVPTNFTEDKWIQGAEAKPGDRSVVHHILVFVDDHQGEKRGLRKDAHLCGYAPGEMPSRFADGTAKRIPAGSDLIFQLHYTPNGRVRQDLSKLGLVFAKAPVTREARTLPIINTKFIIPANRDDVPVSSSMTLPADVRLLSFMPHMHLRGKSFQYTITKPGGEPEIALSVPGYDFGWQSYYILKEPMELPKGTRIDCLAHFDNTASNPHNPDPDKIVRWGEQTFEEMMIGYIDIDVPVGASPREGTETREGEEGREAARSTQDQDDAPEPSQTR